MTNSPAPPAVVDAHCHIDLYPDPKALAGEVERRRIHTIAVTNAPSVFFFSAELAAKSQYLHAAVGLHPEVVRTHAHELPKILDLLEETRFVGEIGLDYVTNDAAERQRQAEVFESILQRCAVLGGRVLTIHSRRSSADVISLVRKTNPGTAILHWFSGPKRDLDRAIDAGCWFSVNPAMLSSQSGKSLIAAMPRERVLTESDGPFVNVGSTPAVPWNTDAVLLHLAGVWRCSPDEASATVRSNFDRLLALAPCVQSRNMNPLDDLPKRHQTHDTAAAAESAFEAAITAAGFFIIQSKDRTDYGTDVQLEVRVGANMTNFRVHGQLKGTETAANADGSVSFPVDRTNLNYLLSQRDSIYVCYHIPSNRLLVRFVHDVYREYEHRGGEWQEQTQVTVRFFHILDDAFQRMLHARAIAAGKSSRDRRLEWTTTPPDKAPALVRRSVPPVEVPADQAQASELLLALYHDGRDDVISASFDRFAAVLEPVRGGMNVAYMAEINLGLNGGVFSESRIRDGIEALRHAMARGKMLPASIAYCQGNGWMALRKFGNARDMFLAAIELLSDDPQLSGIAAQCCKNLGTVYEQLKDNEKAVEFYGKALKHDPDLGEAHFALALQMLRKGEDLPGALAHLDAISHRKGSSIPSASVQAWRIELLFRTRDTVGAFREIQNLIISSSDVSWVWPSCARQVARFGRQTPDSARNAVHFWRQYLRAHPDDLAANREHLLCQYFLHQRGQTVDIDFAGFVAGVERLIDNGDPDPAFLWDRAGHWAQDDKNWTDAERAYRRAYELEPELYGYCLGTALNFLDRHADALPILIVEAEQHQPDAMSWFQVAVAREGIGDLDGCIAAYEKATELNPEYELAWFNLGGIHWNRHELEKARTIWFEAVSRFPDHPQVALLREKLPGFVLGENET